MRGVAFLLLAAGSLAGSGCGADPYRDEPASTVHLFLVEEIKGLDPAQADDQISGTCVLNIYDALYEYDYLARPFRLEPCLAAAMPEVSEDGLTYRIPLRRGVRYADDPCFPEGRGREVVAADVVFCLKRLMDARTNSPGAWTLEGYVRGLDAFSQASASKPKNRTAYEDVEGLGAPDPHTLEIRLTRPYPQLLWILAMPYASVYPPEAIARYGDEFLNHPVGTGPYVVKRFARTQQLVLDRNPSYREDPYPSRGEEEDRAAGRLEDAGRPMPLNDRVVLTVFRESQPQWLYFHQGFLDRTTIPKDNFDVAVDPATMLLRRDLADRGITLQKTPQIEIIYDCFNMRDPVLGAPAGERGRAIRRAISLAFDEEWARKKLYNDRLVSVQGVLLEEFQAYDPAFSNPWKRQPEETREQALERARALLAEAGHPGGRGIPPLYYEVQPSVTDQQFFAAFRRDMREIGLDVRANRVTWPVMLTRIRQGEAQVWGIAWGADYPDAQNFLQLFYGPNASPGPNGSNYQNPEFDRLYEEALRLPPGGARTALYRRMQEIVVDDCVWAFKYRRIGYNLSHAWLHNFKRNAISEKYFKYLRVDPEERRRRIAQWNRPVLLPLWLFLGAALLVLLGTLAGTRRRTRAW